MSSSRPAVLEITILPTSLSLTELFVQLSSKPYATLFDSAESDAGRFSIAVWDPVTVIEARQGKVTITNTKTGEVQPALADPFTTVHREVERRLGSTNIVHDLPQTDVDALPFLIGAAGLAGYDTGRYYEALPNRAKGNYLCPDFAVGIYEQSLIEDKQRGIIYACKLSQHPVFSLQQMPGRRAPFRLCSEWKSNLTQHNYLTALTRIRQYLQAGDCYQVNLAQRFTAEYEGSEFSAYQALRQANRAPFSAFLRLPNATVMSISPERFLSVKGGIVETKPIKGTRPRYKNKRDDENSAKALLSAEKDRAENLMIVDLLRNDLSKHCLPGSVDVPSLFALESYKAVHHMVSTVVGKLKPSSSAMALLAGAFPGGSITGAPKIRAMEIIDELEPHRRNVYCGSIFYLGLRQDMDSSILIRTLLAENGYLHCWAGGGIVIDSVATEEYQETLDKVSRILPVLEKGVD
ncbi:aminodeoxychorismate synthase component I [Aestuariibacter sp. A3R04]|uniref:aminodeoxychorismate synthase component I n=1 Tax=Aestuariibacter sp. A3R04 TaxID=2841571 RepID=UPI001C088C08|nr:aminodeoxychorismate synthase component I [Aestuariibacter sp. A3R04]MBU3022930.1 aminodeoxychorismate synthase component I [Aestuariibacter sp. A3R04]